MIAFGDIQAKRPSCLNDQCDLCKIGFGPDGTPKEEIGCPIYFQILKMYPKINSDRRALYYGYGDFDDNFLTEEGLCRFFENFKEVLKLDA